MDTRSQASQNFESAGHDSSHVFESAQRCDTPSRVGDKQEGVSETHHKRLVADSAIKSGPGNTLVHDHSKQQIRQGTHCQIDEQAGGRADHQTHIGNEVQLATKGRPGQHLFRSGLDQQSQPLQEHNPVTSGASITVVVKSAKPNFRLRAGAHSWWINRELAEAISPGFKSLCAANNIGQHLWLLQEQRVIVSLIAKFLTEGDYDDHNEDSAHQLVCNENRLLVDCAVFCAANRHGLTDLKDLAIRKFRAATSTLVMDPTFAELIRAFCQWPINHAFPGLLLPLGLFKIAVETCAPITDNILCCGDWLTDEQRSLFAPLRAVCQEYDVFRQALHAHRQPRSLSSGHSCREEGCMEYNHVCRCQECWTEFTSLIEDLAFDEGVDCPNCKATGCSVVRAHFLCRPTWYAGF